MTILNASAGVRPILGAGGAAAAHSFEEKGRTVVCVHGEIDIGTLGTLDDALIRAAWSESPEIVVDLRGVRFMDSSGLKVLLRTRDQLAAGGRTLMVRNPAEVVLRLIALFDATELIEA